MYFADFSFNVFSHNFQEAKNNYTNLHTLLYSLRPIYNFTAASTIKLLPDPRNRYGLISVSFAGLPKLADDNILDIYVSNFAYTINKDMGFVKATGKDFNPFAAEDKPLVPVSFRIDLSGQLLLTLDAGTNLGGSASGGGSAASGGGSAAAAGGSAAAAGGSAAAAAAGGSASGGNFTAQLASWVGSTDPKYQSEVVTIAKSLVGETKFQEISEDSAKLQSVITKAKEAKDRFLMNPDGSPSTWNGKQNRAYTPEEQQTANSELGTIKMELLRITGG
jgi:hypothetical protein